MSKHSTQKLFLFVALGLMYCAAAGAQVAPVAVLQIETAYQTRYVYDTADLSTFATVPTPTTRTIPTFATWVTEADIVAITGKPAKGVYLTRQTAINLSPSPAPGQGISDIVATNIVDRILEIWNADGTPIGSIVMLGLDGGPPPPGAPAVLRGSRFAITGGTGAFLGVRGEFGGGPPIPGSPPIHNASVREDPANRRVNGGSNSSFILYLIPMSFPQIAVTPSGPAVVHATDFTPVTAAKPARAGEILTLFATGLGPTRPGVEPGQSFTADPPQIVNSPIEVIVNGASTQVSFAGGYPGAIDGYQVNFQLPAGIAAGQASVHLTAAFISGPDVKIAVQ